MTQILEQHIRAVLPALRAELNSHAVALDKELGTCGDVTGSKVSNSFSPTLVVCLKTESCSRGQ